MTAPTITLDTSEVERLRDELAEAHEQLADAREQIEDLSDALDDTERDLQSLRSELADAEDAVAELEGTETQFDRIAAVLTELGDLHDTERHHGPQRFCPATTCRAYVAAFA